MDAIYAAVSYGSLAHIVKGAWRHGVKANTSLCGRVLDTNEILDPEKVCKRCAGIQDKIERTAYYAGVAEGQDDVMSQAPVVDAFESKVGFPRPTLPVCEAHGTSEWVDNHACVRLSSGKHIYIGICRAGDFSNGERIHGWSVSVAFQNHHTDTTTYRNFWAEGELTMEDIEDMWNGVPAVKPQTVLYAGNQISTDKCVLSDSPGRPCPNTVVGARKVSAMGHLPGCAYHLQQSEHFSSTEPLSGAVSAVEVPEVESVQPAPESASVSFVGVMNGVECIHAAGCREITREQADTYDYVAMLGTEILESNYGDIASDNYEVGTLDYWTSICEEASGGMRVMPCALPTLVMGTTPFGPLRYLDGVFSIDVDGRITAAAKFLSVYYMDDDSSVMRPEIDRAAFNEASLNADDTAREENFSEMSVEWYECFDLSYEFMRHVNQEIRERDARIAEEDASMPGIGEVRVCVCGTSLHDNEEAKRLHSDNWHMDANPQAWMEDAQPDTMEADYIVTVHLYVTVSTDVEIDLGWHEFTITGTDTELDIPEMYGKRHGEGSPIGGWATIIRVAKLICL